MTDPNPKRPRLDPKDQASDFHGTFTHDSHPVTNLQDNNALLESSITTSSCNFGLDFHGNFIDYSNPVTNLKGDNTLLESSTTTTTTTTSSDMTTYDQQRFPNEILILILNYLPKQDRRRTIYQFSFVSKQFNYVGDSFLWKEARLNNNRASEQFLNGLSNASPARLSILLRHVTHLRLRGSCWTNDQWTRLLPHLGNLDHLAICTMNITNLGFQEVPRYCQKLTALELEKTALTEASFFIIGQQCPQLTRLKWRVGPDQFLDWLGFLVPRCPITHLRLLTRHGLVTNTISILHRLDHLKFLEMETVGGYEAFIQAGKTRLLAPPPSPEPPVFWPHLTSLIFDNAADIEDHVLMQFIVSHPHITLLRLKYAQKLTFISLEAINVGLPKLKTMVLRDNQNITLQHVENFIRQAHDLEYVSFRNCWNVARKRYAWIKGVVKIG